MPSMNKKQRLTAYLDPKIIKKVKDKADSKRWTISVFVEETLINAVSDK